MNLSSSSNQLWVCVQMTIWIARVLKTSLEKSLISKKGELKHQVPLILSNDWWVNYSWVNSASLCLETSWLLMSWLSELCFVEGRCNWSNSVYYKWKCCPQSFRESLSLFLSRDLNKLHLPLWGYPSSFVCFFTCTIPIADNQTNYFSAASCCIYHTRSHCSWFRTCQLNGLPAFFGWIWGFLNRALTISQCGTRKHSCRSPVH